MKLVFFGCDDFAAVNLKKLIEDGHQVPALVTQPDKPKGRGLHVEFSPTKVMAMDCGIEVLQPDNLREENFLRRLESFGADVFVVVAYGKFLPDRLLSIPAYFCVNVHPSLLPRYRGAAPVNWAVINGDQETGVTLIKINSSMDGGDILLQQRCPLPADITSADLRSQLAVMGAGMLAALLPKIPKGEYDLLKQDAALATRAPKMHKDLGCINWALSASGIHDLVRGTQPWPGAYTFFNGERLKVLEAVTCQSELSGQPGEIIECRKDGFLVRAGNGAVLIKRVHLAGSRPMDARSFLAGHKIQVGTRLLS